MASSTARQNDKQGNRFKLINTLRATVHGVYYDFHTRALVDDGSGTGTMVAAKHDPLPGHYLRTVMAAQVGHVLGKVDAFYTPGVGDAQANFINVGLNYSMVYEALGSWTWSTCRRRATTSTGSRFTDISNDHLMFDQSTATQALPGMTGGQIGGHYIDTEWETYIKHIREGRLDDDDNTKDHVAAAGVHDRLPGRWRRRWAWTTSRRRQRGGRRSRTR